MQRTRRPRLHGVAPATPATFSAPVAVAREFDTGVDDLVLRRDNTVKYSAATRLKSANADLVSSPNLHDGDRNFGKGLIGLPPAGKGPHEVLPRIKGSGFTPDALADEGVR